MRCIQRLRMPGLLTLPPDLIAGIEGASPERLDALPPGSDSTGDGMDAGGGVADDQGRAS